MGGFATSNRSRNPTEEVLNVIERGFTGGEHGDQAGRVGFEGMTRLARG